MEELQDAIEDAQYVNAISTQEDGPRPVLAWPIPTLEQLEAWKGSKDITLDFLLSSAIGLFLFSAYLKDNCEDHVRINFVEDVIRWRRLKGRQRLQKARRMLMTYFKPPSKDSDGNVIVPEKIEIDEYELERPIPKIENLEQLYNENMDPTFAKCLLGLDGPLCVDIFAGLEEVERARALSRKENSLTPEASLAEHINSSHVGDPQDPAEQEELVQSTSTDATKTQVSETKDEAKQEVLPDEEKENEEEADEEENMPDGEQPVAPETPDTASTPYRLLGRRESIETQMFPDSYFDGPEAVVVHGLRQQYWEGFTQSEQYTKLLNFLWYQDRPVVPEDFFVMRVLGRGGFGLVTGKGIKVDCREAYPNFVLTICLRTSLQKGNVGKALCHESYEQEANKDEEIRAVGVERETIAGGC
jgi:beta-adrenergic-receptor kinase